MIEPPFYPIIYLRGYAGSQGEVEDTVSTPYMGFNLGSTRVRQIHTGEMEPHVFESPVIRLMKDHGYADACRDGQMRPRGPVPGRSIWIFRYYDVVDEDHGDGVRREIEFHARKLGEFLRDVRKAVLGDGEDPGRPTSTKFIPPIYSEMLRIRTCCVSRRVVDNNQPCSVCLMPA